MASVTDTYPLQWQLGLAVLITTQPIKDAGGNVIPPAQVLAYITELQTNLAAANSQLASANSQVTTLTANIASAKMAIQAAMPSVMAAMNNGQSHRLPTGTPKELSDPTVPARLFNQRLVNKLNEVLNL